MTPMNLCYQFYLIAYQPLNISKIQEKIKRDSLAVTMTPNSLRLSGLAARSPRAPINALSPFDTILLVRCTITFSKTAK